jgi:hypothetical protein
LALIAFSACTRRESTAIEADIVVAVIQHVLTADTVAGASTANPLFIGVPGDSGALNPDELYRDPPSAWLARFSAISSSLQPFSRARISPNSGRITDASDSSSSRLLLVSSVHRHSEVSASVEVAFVTHAGGGRGWTYDLSRERGKWRVTSTHGQWDG